jgi:hypothetical protein
VNDFDIKMYLQAKRQSKTDKNIELVAVAIALLAIMLKLALVDSPYLNSIIFCALLIVFVLNCDFHIFGIRNITKNDLLSIVERSINADVKTIERTSALKV